MSTVKHAHHDVDIDQPGKDSWRHRQAGASEVLLVCDQRMALVHEFDAPQELDVHAMLAQLDPRMDWALVEGFQQGDLPKIELWRAPAPGQPGAPFAVLERSAACWRWPPMRRSSCPSPCPRRSRCWT